ncbi:Uncharacterized protein TCM_020505 [Theobroma cacao]|uniref:Uncharacterized protein n=1 Tax=Theobroma cacao TaxID=3641 RepID=A0A061EKY3_THECC|nr:Uncharacterized protein TCM_020505 [Theobroma cacao]
MRMARLWVAHISAKLHGPLQLWFGEVHLKLVFLGELTGVRVRLAWCAVLMWNWPEPTIDGRSALCGTFALLLWCCPCTLLSGARAACAARIMWFFVARPDSVGLIFAQLPFARLKCAQLVCILPLTAGPCTARIVWPRSDGASDMQICGMRAQYTCRVAMLAWLVVLAGHAGRTASGCVVRWPECRCCGPTTLLLRLLGTPFWLAAYLQSSINSLPQSCL